MYRHMWSISVLVMLVLAAMPGASAPAAAQTPTASPAVSPGPAVVHQKALSGIWGSSTEDVFAVGLDGTILHYDGKAWSPMTGSGG